MRRFSSGGRLRAVAMLALMFAWGAAAFSTITLATPTAAVAQDGEAPSDDAPSDSAKKTPKEQSALAWFVGALGWEFGIPFLAISFWFVALLVMCILMLRRDTVCPPQLAELMEAHLNEKRYQEAFDLAKSDDSFLGMVLAAGMAKLQNGYGKVVEAMEEVGADEGMKMEQKLGHIALIGTISPMVGLLGTVYGMVQSFQSIERSAATPSAQELAKGISTALITTLVGLTLAIPAVGAFTFLKNRLNRLMLETGMIASNLMARFENIPAKK
ncbi:MAG: MotA/TolQ/ExbB proton channel family protein [Pirellulales bacterium]